MENLKATKHLVQFILERDERARNSDSYLYLRVIRVVADRNGIDLNDIPVTEFLLNMNAPPFRFPPFESVRRARQKVQAECPHLAACEKVAGFRAENQREYLTFARGCWGEES